MSHHAFSVVVVCLALVTPSSGLAGSVDTKRIPKATVDALHQQFLMGEVLTIVKASHDRASSQAHLRARTERFKFLGTQQQEPMTIDGYTVQDLASPIVGYSLFYHGNNGPLVILYASVNPLQPAAVDKISDLIARSFDSVSTPDGSRLYFLGIYDLDPTRVIKIMVRKGSTSLGPDYAIGYAVSGR